MTSSDETDLEPDAVAGLEGRVGAIIEGSHDGRGLRIGIGCARFNGGISLRLLEGVLTAADDLGVDRRDLEVAWVPGAFELPLLAKRFCDAGTVDAVIAIGAVIRGDTGHYDFVAGECARGLQDVSLATGMPVIFGVLTTDTVEQARVRSEPGPSNKGAEALTTAVELVRLLRQPRLS